MFLLLYVVQYLLLPILYSEGYFAVVVSVVLNISSLAYYHYMICMGFSTLPFLKNVHVFLVPILFWLLIGVLCLLFRINLTLTVVNLHF